MGTAEFTVHVWEQIVGGRAYEEWKFETRVEADRTDVRIYDEDNASVRYSRSRLSELFIDSTNLHVSLRDSSGRNFEWGSASVGIDSGVLSVGRDGVRIAVFDWEQVDQLTVTAESGHAEYQCGTCSEWIAFGTTHAPLCEHYSEDQDSDPNAATEARGGE